MLSDKSTVCPLNLLDIAHKKRGVKAAIVNAGKTLPMLSAMDSVKEKLIEPVFIGDKNDNFKKFLSMSKQNIQTLVTEQGKFKEYDDLKKILELKWKEY